MSNDHRLLAELRRHNLIKPLVECQIISEAVCNEHPSSEDLELARRQYLQANNLTDDEALSAFLAKQGWGEGDFNWQLSLPLRIKKHCLSKFGHKAEAYFLIKKNQLDKVVYSLLRTKDPFMARELYLRINEGEANFGDLASQFSEGPERNTKGIIGPAPMTQAHPIIAETLRTTKAGLLLPPLRVEDWWIVLRLESYVPATLNEQMIYELSRELFNKWVSEEVTRKMEGLIEPGEQPTAE